MAVLRDVRSDGSHHPDHLHLADVDGSVGPPIQTTDVLPAQSIDKTRDLRAASHRINRRSRWQRLLAWLIG